MQAQDIQIVLSEPRESRNVGAVCRAMKTMGLSNLSIVGNRAIDAHQAGILAIHAADILQKATYFDTLQDSLRGASFIAGVTRRQGKKRKAFSIPPEELAQRVSRIQEGTAAIVFGNEESGLSDQEMSLCHIAVHIPSSPMFPSLNLSHAVQIITYELFKRLALPANPSFTPVTEEELDHLVRGILNALHEIGFQTREGPRGMEAFLKDILSRAQLSPKEKDRFGGIFEKISGMLTKKEPG